MSSVCNQFLQSLVNSSINIGNVLKAAVFILFRYKLSGKVMPLLKDWMCETVGISLDHKTPAQPELTAADIPTPVQNEEFISGVKRMGISYTDDPHDRVFRAHGNQKI